LIAPYQHKKSERLSRIKTTRRDRHYRDEFQGLSHRKILSQLQNQSMNQRYHGIQRNPRAKLRDEDQKLRREMIYGNQKGRQALPHRYRHGCIQHHNYRPHAGNLELDIRE